MRKIHLLSLGLSLCAFGADRLPLMDGGEVKTSATPIVSLSGPEMEKVKGTLTATFPGKIEIIEFGKKTGHYANGLIFHSSALPPGLRSELRGQHILQVVFGTENPGDRTPRFASLSLIFRKIPTKTVALRSILPKEPALAENIALFMFSSPLSAKESPDEERLRGTYYSDMGTVELTPKGPQERVLVENDSLKYPFIRQTFRLVINSELKTPFNDKGTGLTGSIETPVLWPSGKNSESLVKNVARESLAGPTSLPLSPEGISQHKRDVAGSQKPQDK